jgi:hypothetical protein
VDGDGRRKVVINAMYCDNPGTYAYKLPANPRNPWKKQTIQSGLSAEGTAAELTPGKISIVSQGWMEQSYVHIWDLGH